MAKMTLELSEVAAQLKPLLAQHLSDVKVYVEGDKGVISGKKGFVIPVEVRFSCKVSAPATRVTIDLSCSLAAKGALEAFAGKLMQDRPYIEKLDSSTCVINLTKVPVGDKQLTDFIELKAAQIPAPNGLFAALDCTFKSQ